MNAPTIDRASLSTTWSRSMRDKTLRALCTIPLGFDRRILEIETSKGVNGGVSTNATVFQMTEDGRGKQHAFGLAGGGDFRRTLKAARTKRATEKAIAEQHGDVLNECAAETFAAAVAHYKPAAPVSGFMESRIPVAA